MHVAQSLFHDIVPAQRLGFHTAHVNRPSRLIGTGLAPAATISAEITVPDLKSLADRLLE
jgi:2-haloacid dehalogenase